MTSASTGPSTGPTTGAMTDDQVRARAARWLAQDPDEHTRAELRELLDDEDPAALRERFAGTLTFGTAGLRGALGAGPTRMNRVTVAQAAAGLAAYLNQGVDDPSVVIGYDARHLSDVFARDTAELMAGAGVRATLLPAPLPTPVLAFAIRRLGASAGVMVTASHNPPQDNGYKVYLSDSSQIVPPVDGQIAELIAQVGPVDELPRSTAWTTAGDDVLEAYLAAAIRVPGDGPRDVLSVHTALHGVGSAVFLRAAELAGFTTPQPVSEQQQPDPDFPTVAFPNPEEPGAMDLALAQADRVGADVVVANDPDADRCAVAVRHEGTLRMLTGDELGALLGDELLRRGVEGTYAASIVSSSLLGRLAAAHGQPFRQTLTGFKWIGKVPQLAFGYEEALGYCVAPSIALDKDGVTAGLLTLALAARLKAQSGRTLVDRLHEIYAEHGWHATGQVSLRFDDVERITTLMTRLRDAPPTTLGPLEVGEFVDLADGWAGLPPTDGVRLQLSGDTRVVVRPSGTEPKLKCYLQVVRPDEQSAQRDLAALTAAVRALLA